jgi:hypothetical protein
MRPISDINIGDQYERGYPFTLTWVIEEICETEKMAKIKAYKNGTPLNQPPFWKKNTDSVFNKRIYNGKTNKVES